MTALQDPACYPHDVERVRLIETHISYVLLTGTYAYKLKKPLDLGFVDFTTLARRRFFCEEELRLNRRLAPTLYLDVVAIGGTPLAPRLGAQDGVFDYAVRMREFPQAGLLDGVLERGELSARHIDAMAAKVADFHRRIGRAGARLDYGSAPRIAAPMRQNFEQVGALIESSTERETLASLQAWSIAQHEARLPLFTQRHEQGFVRECHGDLHLGNIALVEGQIEIFDGIEFDPNLRWIDVINEIAFLVMDLQERGRPDFAWRFLTAYLEDSADYAGLRLLRYYQVYRAMVRAKVCRIRALQPHLGAQERAAALDSYSAYVGYARSVIAPARPALIITHGLSGSGKTSVSQALLEKPGAVRVRSDIERKRLGHLAPLAKSNSRAGGGLYAEAATRATYEELGRLAGLILEAGYVAIVDAAFLKRWQRELMRRLAEELRVPFVAVSCVAEESALRRRIMDRGRAGRDASEATLEVLAGQLLTQEPLRAEEGAAVVVIDTQELPPEEAATRVAATLQ